MVNVQDLSLCYDKKTVIDSAEFHIEKGQAAVLVGDNGSGKSTLLAAVAGAMKPKRGSVQLGGTVGYVPQGSGLVEELTFADNLRFFAALAGVDVPARLPMGADVLRKVRVRDMSGGMKKLCSIVCAVMAKPDILLLDEPCAALDAEHKAQLRDYLCQMKAEGTTILYVGHNPDEYETFADCYLCVGPAVRQVDAREYQASHRETAGERI